MSRESSLDSRRYELCIRNLRCFWQRIHCVYHQVKDIQSDKIFPRKINDVDDERRR